MRTETEIRADLVGERDGETIRPRDYDRLNRQQLAVFEVMRDGKWRTLRQISDEVGCPEASVSARLRDFRKEEFGEHRVHRHRLEEGNGLHEYCLEINYEPRE